MEKKIFDDFGFLSKEGKAFVEDGFTKEVKRVLATATCQNDILVISSILKSIVGDHATRVHHELKDKKPASETTPLSSEQKPVRTETVRQNPALQFVETYYRPNDTVI